VFQETFSKENSAMTNRKRLFANALITFASLLTKHSDFEITSDLIEQIKSVAHLSTNQVGSVEDRRAAFKQIEDLLLPQLDIKIGREEIAKYREKALGDAGLDVMGQILKNATKVQGQTLPVSENRYLEAEFIAIYW
jgi:hypothetical protein